MKGADPIADAASAWIARRNGGLSSQERAELSAWLQADPRHAQAFRTFESAWDRLSAPRHTGEDAVVLHELSRREKTRRRRSAVAATVLAAACVGFGIFIVPSRSSVRRPSVAARPDRHVFPDGSTAELNAGAEIAVAFTSSERRIRLDQGEALFAPAKNPERPFIVEVAGVEVEAVGTAFSVRRNPDSVEVLVTEGRVAIEAGEKNALPGSSSTLVDAGHYAIFPLEKKAPVNIRPVTAPEIATVLAWRGKRVEFTDTPLAEALSVFNREQAFPLEIDDPAIRGRRISGIFWSDDAETFVRLLESGVGVRAERDQKCVRLYAK